MTYSYTPNPSEIDTIPLGGFVDNTISDIRVRVVMETGDMWKWCQQNVARGTWKYTFLVVGTGGSYVFKNGLDAVAFKLACNLI